MTPNPPFKPSVLVVRRSEFPSFLCLELDGRDISPKATWLTLRRDHLNRVTADVQFLAEDGEGNRIYDPCSRDYKREWMSIGAVELQSDVLHDDLFESIKNEVFSLAEAFDY